MAHIAALTAGWQRRLGGKAGPLGPVSGGSGESPNGAVLQVELLIGGTWTDITSYVMTRDGSGHVSVTRGQPNESGRTEPSTCRFQLNNRDGRFSPRNPTSPYYGKIGRNTPLRVSVPSGNDKSYRFWGEVAVWPQRWDTTGTDVWVDLEAAGILRRLGQGASPIGSAMYLALTAPVGDGGLVAAYWPCEDASGATAVASALGGPAMTITGTPRMANYTGFVASTALPTMGDASFTGVVPAYPLTEGVSLEFLVAMPAAGSTDGQVLCRFTTTGTAPTWDVTYYAGPAGTGTGAVVLLGYDSLGTLIYNSVGGALPMDGTLNQISVALIQDGPDIFFEIVGRTAGGESAGGASVFASGATIGLITSVTMCPGRGLSETALGHVRVRTGGDDVLLNRALTAFAGERAGVRATRLCSQQGISFDSIGSSSDTQWMGAQASASLLTLVDECIEADNGILYEQTGAIGLGFRTRVSLENQNPVLSLSYSGFNLAESLVPVDDDQYTRNDITVTRSGGSSARSVQSEGPLSVQQAPAGVGRYDTAVTVNVELDDDLPDQAGWRMHLGTVDEARYPTVSVNLAHPTFVANPTLRAQVLAVRPGDRIAITSPPPWVPPDDISQLVLGFSESIDHFQHRITFNCAPESPWRVALLGDSTLCRLDTSGSQVAVEAAAGATSLSVATTAGTVWTTSDVPFDAVVAGERVTVTAVSGATSPQTFTVTRAVNGVSKVLPVGADVRLYQPAILAL